MGVCQQYEGVAQHVAQVCQTAGRDPQEVTIVAVSKTVGIDEVAEAAAGGANDFGENRPEQLIIKADVYDEFTWHFIGNIQSRRIRDIVGRAALIHSLYQPHHATKINEVAAEKGLVQDVLIEVNVSGEESKSGLEPSQVRDMLQHCTGLENVRVRGLMTMAPRADEQATRSSFAGLAALLHELRAEMPEEQAAVFTELSMGMTEDWPVAIEEGATIVRIGRAIFSPDFA